MRSQFSLIAFTVHIGLLLAVEAAALDFGTVTAGQDGEITTSVAVTAPAGSTIASIVLDGGLWPAGTFRRMAGSVTGQFLRYEIFQDDAHTKWNINEAKTPWVPVVSNGNPVNVSIRAKVYTTLNTVPGTYTDTVTITVNY